MQYADPNFNERRQARIERLEELARKTQAAGNAGIEASMKMLECIPMGQPILVGHHSEGRHRALLRRSDNRMRRASEALKKAEYYRRRVAGAGTGGISSKDPTALEQLRAKLADMEAKQQQRKDVNAAYRKFKKNPATLDSSPLSDALKTMIRNYKPEYSFDKGPFPSYSLQNNNANMKRVKDRIKTLERVEAMPEPEVIEGNGLTITTHPINGRLIVRFDHKPSAAIQEQMKTAFIIRRDADGWYWMAQQWSPNAKELAMKIAGKECNAAD